MKKKTLRIFISINRLGFFSLCLFRVTRGQRLASWQVRVSHPHTPNTPVSTRHARIHLHTDPETKIFLSLTSSSLFLTNKFPCVNIKIPMGKWNKNWVELRAAATYPGTIKISCGAAGATGGLVLGEFACRRVRRRRHSPSLFWESGKINKQTNKKTKKKRFVSIKKKPQIDTRDWLEFLKGKNSTY